MAGEISSHGVCAQETTSCWRKFSGPLDVPWSLLATWWRNRSRATWHVARSPASACYVARHVGTVLAAMRAHRSQAAWFRWLFLCASRYTYVNTLRALPP